MQDKSTRFTLSATVIFLLLLSLVAWVLNRKAAERDITKLPVPGLETPVNPTPPERIEPPPSPAPTLPPGADGLPLADYQVITRCGLADDPENDGDTFLLTTPDGPFRFCLYWVDTVETDGGSPESVRRMADYFRFDTEEQMRDLGREAREFSLRLLKNTPFRVVTKWDMDPDEKAYRAFIYLNPDGKELVNLSHYLVRNGLAMIRESGDLPVLPDGTDSQEFLRQLQEAEAEAHIETHGAWAVRQP